MKKKGGGGRWFKYKKTVRKEGGGGSKVPKKVYEYIWTALYPYPIQPLVLSTNPPSSSALTVLVISFQL